MDLNVLCISMEHGVLGQLHIVDLVVVDWNQSRCFDSKVLEQSAKPYGFICRDGGTLVLDLSSRQSHCALLLAAPRNNCAPKKTREAGC